MKAPIANLRQNSIFPTLDELLSRKNGLRQLAEVIDWSRFETAFSPLFSQKMGRPAKPIRRMVGLLILKHVRNLSDERVVEEWAENPYFQYFCGEVFFAQGQPCDASELVHFRQRIGEAGMELILAESIRIQKDDLDQDGGDVTVDTTVQHKNIAFPTDDGLRKKIIRKCVSIAKKEGVQLRQTYEKTLKKLVYAQRGGRTKKAIVQKRKASNRVKTIALYLVRELLRKLPEDALQRNLPEIDLFTTILNQKRGDSGKIYSLHEPHVQCIAKGKAFPKYEFGCKVSVAQGKKSGIILGALAFEKNPFDGHTLPEVFDQIERVHDSRPTRAICDLGYRGPKMVDGTQIVLPDPASKKTPIQKANLRKDLRRRAAIEAQISHQKRDHRLGRNFYKGLFGDQINAVLAGAAANFARWIRCKAKPFGNFFRFLFDAFWAIARSYRQPVLCKIDAPSFFIERRGLLTF